MLPKLIEPAEYEWGERRWVKLKELAEIVDMYEEKVWLICQNFYPGVGHDYWLDEPDGELRIFKDAPKATYRVMVPYIGLRQLREILENLERRSARAR